MKSAFLNNVLQKEVFVEKLPEYIKKGQEKQFYKLNKTLYRLKQTPCAWDTWIDAYLLWHGFQRSSFKHTIYIKSNSNCDVIVVCLYVDDLIFIGNNQ